MAYSDLDTIQIPADNADALAAWGVGVNANSAALWSALNTGWKPWLNAIPSVVTALGDTLQEGYYHHLGYTIQGMWTMTLDGATIGLGAAVLNLPQPYHNSGTLKVIGSCVFLDSSTTKYYGGVVVTNNTGSASTATMWLRGGLQITDPDPVAWDDGDTLMVNVFYESSQLNSI